ncbi:MAG: hypothetical protein HC809_10075 [Gammaproteobacteria bacterium]|nr:hypothetical protein [Gammaproteobacteria bacterium]
MPGRSARRIRFAIVVPQGRYERQVSDYIERATQHAVPWRLNVFDTLAEARIWAELKGDH